MHIQPWKVFYACILIAFACTSCAGEQLTPPKVKVGVLVSLTTVRGKLIKTALEYAAEEVNKNANILKGRKLELLVAESNCSVLQSAFSALQLLDAGVLAIIGPQSSAESYFVAQMAEAIQVPLISISATDPSLSQLENPYFVRMVPSEAIHMAAVADIMHNYGWNEVIALFSDDELGRNTVRKLKESLDSIDSKISYKAIFGFNTSSEYIYMVLAKVRKMKSTVLVVNVQPWIAPMLLSVAIKLRMLGTGYTWIVNNDILNVLSELNLQMNSSVTTNDIIGTRPHVPLSSKLQEFNSQLNKKLGDNITRDLSVNMDALYAYDALWVFAKAVDRLKFDKDFSNNEHYSGENFMERQKFVGGPELLKHILRSNISGETGKIEFDSKGDRRHSILEVVNGIGKQVEVVGYWSISSRNFSISPPVDSFVNMFNATKHVNALNRLNLRRISAVSNNHGFERHLKIIIPRKVGYRKFVNITGDQHNNRIITGFCIEVFKAALKYLPYNVTYNFTPYGNGFSNPQYTEMIKKVADKEFDGAVGDIAITTERVKLVDFTLPYIDTGIVVAVPKKVTRANRIWGFLEPFTWRMWCTIGAFFIFTGLVIWFLEHKDNEDFQGKRKKQLLTALWFILSTLFSAHKENVKSVLGRAVLIVWLFVVLILTSSYTANLTSILTIEQLRPTINGLAGLVTSKVPIAIQAGSYVREFLIDLGISKDRFVTASSANNYTQLARNGPQRHGVGAIVDELPYIQVLLSMSCDFEISGEEVFKVGWGFAFQKDSKIDDDFTNAFLKMTENGEIDDIHKKFLENNNCKSGQTSSQFRVSTFMGLFLITGAITTLAFIIHCIVLLKSLCYDPDTHRRLSGRSSFGKLVHLSKLFSLKLIEEANANDPTEREVCENETNTDGVNLRKRRSRCSLCLYKCQKRRRAVQN